MTSGTKFLFSAVNYLTLTEARLPATKAKVTPLSIAGLVPGDNWDRLGGCVISRSRRILDWTQRSFGSKWDVHSTASTRSRGKGAPGCVNCSFCGWD